MINKKNFVFLILLFSLLQVTVLHYLPFFGAKPDLFLICVLAASLYFEYEFALAIGLFCGILKDIFSIGPFGINTFLLPITSFLVMRLSRKVDLDNTPVLCAAAFLITVCYAIASRIILGYLGTMIPFWVFLRIAFLGSLYTALIFPLTLRFIKRTAYP
jgi:rod shape-determining protein MreD